jgi:carbonic anhydrase
LSVAATIRARVLRGIALNRIPGFHFPGNFLDVSFDRVGRAGTLLSIDPGPWCRGRNGQTDLASLTILADLACGSAVRAQLTRDARIATVSLSLQFTGAPRAGRLAASGEFQQFFRDGAGRLGLSRVAVTGGAGLICYGTASFMALSPPKGMTLHPVPLRSRKSPSPLDLKEKDLFSEESKILARADAALGARGNFIEDFWGGDGVLQNGLHAGNRVGHAQGGILIALAARSAAAKLKGDWRLSGVTALYISPGEGRVLRAKVHGRAPGQAHGSGAHRGQGQGRPARAGSRHQPRSRGTIQPMTPDQVLARLKEGNARFMSGQARFPTVQKEVLAELAKGQRPYATILGCSDSRVPPELVFDAGFGELFVVRVAGNVLGPSILGTLQYAGAHLHTPLFVVLGHEGCGAVQAALASKFEGATQKSRIALLLENILPALEGLDGAQPADALLHSAVEANVRNVMRELLATPEAQARISAADIKLVGAVYELESGRVRFLE